MVVDYSKVRRASRASLPLPSVRRPPRLASLRRRSLALPLSVPAPAISFALLCTDFSLVFWQWDNLDVSDSEEDEDEGRPGEPLVHKLDPSESEGMRFGNVTVRPGRPGAEEAAPAPSSGRGSESGSKGPGSAGAGAASETRLTELSRNGARYDKYLWSQDEDTCVLSVLVPRGARAKDVVVSLSGQDLMGGIQCARGVRVEHKPSQTVVEGELQHAFRAEEDDLVSHWEVKDLDETRRLVRVELQKQVVPTTRIWWNKCFKSEPKEVEVAAAARGGHKASAQDVWEEAHKMFREKLQNSVH